MKRRAKNERVTLQRVSEEIGTNDFGETTDDSWEDIEDRFAHILSKGFREQWRAGTQVIEATHLVELWFDSVTSVLTEANRLLWRGRVFQILDVADTHKERREILVVCREVKSQEAE